jgi:DNA ligase-1
MKNLFDTLEATPGRNDKLQILSNNKSNELLKSIFNAALNPYTQYFIQKIPAYTRHTETITLVEFLEGIKDLTQRKVTGHAAQNHLSNLLSKLESGDAVIAERIIKKDLRCGIQESTVNKVWDDLVPTYPCLLGKGYDEKSIKAIVYPAISQVKSDGMRANVHCTPESILIFGRSGKPIDTLGHLEAAFEPFRNRKCVFDGELVVLNHDGTVMSRKKGNGILNKAIKGTISEDEASRVCIKLWDWIPHADFVKKVFKTAYDARYATLCSIVKSDSTDNFVKVLSGSSKIAVTENRIVHNLAEALDHFEEMLNAGEEGTMLKNVAGIWEDKRSKDLVKMKSEKECELVVTGWNPGTPGTKNEKLIGSLVCQSADGGVEVSISGFSDALRQEITDDIDDWIGCIVTVKYNERIKSKGANRANVDSLFLPRFEERRYDKSIADHSSKIE